MPTLTLAPASTGDYRRLAEQRLPRRLFDYLDGGSYAEATLAENVAAFRAVRLKQSVMRNVAETAMATSLLGEDWRMPLALAPIGLAGMMARRAETQAKRAADRFGVPYCLSTVSICSLEEVAAVATRPFWFQLYLLKDRGAVRNLLGRARAAGVTTLIFTVDLAVLGARYRDVRNGMSGDAGTWSRLRGGLLSYLLHPGWTYDVGVRGKPHVFGNLIEYAPHATTPADFTAWTASQFDPSADWRDVAWVRREWPGRLIIKGVLTPEDARAAIDVGADAVVVSNHGGRQLDGVAPTIEALPRVVEAVKDAAPVMIDSGVRSGLDILRARALGAAAALIGRPWIYAVAAKGEEGLHALLKTFEAELRVGMALTGCARLADAGPALLDRETGQALGPHLPPP